MWWLLLLATLERIHCESCDGEELGHLHLLQTRGSKLSGESEADSTIVVGNQQAQHEGRQDRPQISSGIAFEGGGFRAFAVGIGWLAGMMAATKKPVEEILRVKAIASNSGGSWFTGPLLYSKNFNQMMQAMAAEPDRAANVFQIQWGNSWKHIARNDKEAFPEEVACCSPKGFFRCGLGIYSLPNQIKMNENDYCCPEGIVPRGCKTKGSFSCGTWNYLSNGYGLPLELTFGQTQYCCPKGADSKYFDKGQGCLTVSVRKNFFQGVQELGSTLAWFIFDSHVDYDDIIGKMLEIPGDLRASEPISSTPVPWAKGKDYLVAQSFLTPTEDGDAMAYQGTFGKLITSQAVKDSKNELESWPCSGSLCGSQVPARFSTTLGVERSPLPITSHDAESALQMEYAEKSRRLGVLWYHTIETAQSSKTLKNWHSSHEVPIKYAVGGSSALLGSLNVIRPAMIPTALQKVIPTWIMKRLTAGEIPFLAEADSLGYSNFQRAKAMLKVDDSVSNLPAIARSHMIEMADAGQIDNTAIGHLLSAGHTNIVAIYNTDGFTPQKQDVMKSFHQLLSEKPSTVTSAAGYTVFKENVEEVTKQIGSFEKIPALPGAQELAAIWAGELQLSTVDSPPYGLKAGVHITVRMVIVDGQSISCCGVDIDEYAIYMREIVQTLAANKAFAAKILNWF